MRVSVAQFVQIHDVKILFNAADNHDGMLFVCASDNPIKRRVEGKKVHKVARAAKHVATYVRKENGWYIQT